MLNPGHAIEAMWFVMDLSVRLKRPELAQKEVKIILCNLQGGWDHEFAYLNRRGEVLLSLKGGKWKGCFHVPRGLYQIWQTLETI